MKVELASPSQHTTLSLTTLCYTTVLSSTRGGGITISLNSVALTSHQTRLSYILIYKAGGGIPTSFHKVNLASPSHFAILYCYCCFYYYYTTLPYTILHYSLLYYIIPYHTTIYNYYTILYHTIPYYAILYYAILYYIAATLRHARIMLYNTALRCTVLYYTAL